MTDQVAGVVPDTGQPSPTTHSQNIATDAHTHSMADTAIQQENLNNTSAVNNNAIHATGETGHGAYPSNQDQSPQYPVTSGNVAPHNSPVTHQQQYSHNSNPSFGEGQQGLPAVNDRNTSPHESRPTHSNGKKGNQSPNKILIGHTNSDGQNITTLSFDIPSAEQQRQFMQQYINTNPHLAGVDVDQIMTSIWSNIEGNQDLPVSVRTYTAFMTLQCMVMMQNPRVHVGMSVDQYLAIPEINRLAHLLPNHQMTEFHFTPDYNSANQGPTKFVADQELYIDPGQVNQLIKNMGGKTVFADVYTQWREKAGRPLSDAETANLNVMQQPDLHEFIRQMHHLNVAIDHAARGLPQQDPRVAAQLDFDGLNQLRSRIPGQSEQSGFATAVNPQQTGRLPGANRPGNSGGRSAASMPAASIQGPGDHQTGYPQDYGSQQHTMAQYHITSATSAHGHQTGYQQSHGPSQYSNIGASPAQASSASETKRLVGSAMQKLKAVEAQNRAKIAKQAQAQAQAPVKTPSTAQGRSYIERWKKNPNAVKPEAEASTPQPTGYPHPQESQYIPHGYPGQLGMAPGYYSPSQGYGSPMQGYYGAPQGYGTPSQQYMQPQHGRMVGDPNTGQYLNTGQYSGSPPQQLKPHGPAAMKMYEYFGEEPPPPTSTVKAGKTAKQSTRRQITKKGRPSSAAGSTDSISLSREQLLQLAQSNSLEDRTAVLAQAGVVLPQQATPVSQYRGMPPPQYGGSTHMQQPTMEPAYAPQMQQYDQAPPYGYQTLEPGHSSAYDPHIQRPGTAISYDSHSQQSGLAPTSGTRMQQSSSASTSGRRIQQSSSAATSGTRKQQPGLSSTSGPETKYAGQASTPGAGQPIIPQKRVANNDESVSSSSSRKRSRKNDSSSTASHQMSAPQISNLAPSVMDNGGSPTAISQDTSQQMSAPQTTSLAPSAMDIGIPTPAMSREASRQMAVPQSESLAPSAIGIGNPTPAMTPDTSAAPSRINTPANDNQSVNRQPLDHSVNLAPGIKPGNHTEKILQKNQIRKRSFEDVESTHPEALPASLSEHQLLQPVKPVPTMEPMPKKMKKSKENQTMKNSTPLAPANPMIPEQTSKSSVLQSKPTFEYIANDGNAPSRSSKTPKGSRRVYDYHRFPFDQYCHPVPNETVKQKLSRHAKRDQIITEFLEAYPDVKQALNAIKAAGWKVKQLLKGNNTNCPISCAYKSNPEPIDQAIKISKLLENKARVAATTQPPKATSPDDQNSINNPIDLTCDDVPAALPSSSQPHGRPLIAYTVQTPDADLRFNQLNSQNNSLVSNQVTKNVKTLHPSTSQSSDQVQELDQHTSSQSTNMAPAVQQNLQPQQDHDTPVMADQQVQEDIQSETTQVVDETNGKNEAYINTMDVSAIQIPINEFEQPQPMSHRHHLNDEQLIKIHIAIHVGCTHCATGTCTGNYDNLSVPQVAYWNAAWQKQFKAPILRAALATFHGFQLLVNDPKIPVFDDQRFPENALYCYRRNLLNNNGRVAVFNNIYDECYARWKYLGIEDALLLDPQDVHSMNHCFAVALLKGIGRHEEAWEESFQYHMNWINQLRERGVWSGPPWTVANEEPEYRLPDLEFIPFFEADIRADQYLESFEADKLQNKTGSKANGSSGSLTSGSLKRAREDDQEAEGSTSKQPRLDANGSNRNLQQNLQSQQQMSAGTLSANNGTTSTNLDPGTFDPVDEGYRQEYGTDIWRGSIDDWFDFDAASIEDSNENTSAATHNGGLVTDTGMMDAANAELVPVVVANTGDDLTCETRNDAGENM